MDGFAVSRSEQQVSLSFGPMSIGEERLNIDLKDFDLVQSHGPELLAVEWVKNSVQWVRLENDLLLPRARAVIKIKSESTDSYIFYNDETILLQKRKSDSGESILETDLYISLFHPKPILVFHEGKKISEISIKAHEIVRNDKQTHLIDYSCAPFGLKIDGLEGRYLSAGCQLLRVGEFGSETPLLEVRFTAVNTTLKDGTDPPYTVLLKNNDPVEIKVKENSNTIKTVKISAQLPERLHRFGMAFGVGPYRFEARESGGRKKNEIAPSLMLYGNLFFSRATSLRFFNALVANGPLFNNFGMYFGYEMAQVLDKRFDLVALLGFQGLTFDYGESGTKSTTQVIYPQGFELAYRHAFGMKNYTLGVGMFIQPSSEEPYRNIWVRFGKSIFGEVNLISWESGSRRALMWGFTMAFPLAKFL
jgi:hypothetical protein